jgi:hypothetical protein
MRWSLLRNKKNFIETHSLFYKEAYICDIVYISAVPINILEHTVLQKLM